MVGRNSFFLGIKRDNAVFIFTGKGEGRVEERLELIRDSFPHIKTFYIMDQIHGNNVVWIKKGSNEKISILDGTDGMITNLKDVALCVLTADCLPLLFSSPNGSVKGVVHCGWKGLEKGIVKRTLDMLEVNGFKPENLIFSIGPSICGNCYEVGEEFKKLSIGRFLEHRGGKNFLSLQKVCKERLSERGVLEENIKVIPLCTYENNDLFFSHRRGDKERQISLVLTLP